MAYMKENIWMRTFGFFKIPLLFFIKPQIIELTEERVVVKVPLKRRNKNHLKSMYFGVLCAGADTAGGLIAMYHIQKKYKNVRFVFKDFQAQFLKRAHADVHFTCNDGKLLLKLVETAAKGSERVEETVHVVATTPSITGEEPVATFQLTISLKKK